MAKKNRYKTGMSQAEIVRIVREFLQTRPGVPCDILAIQKNTGVPKSLIDRHRSLSRRHDIKRSTKDNGVRWTYMGAVDPADIVEPKISFTHWAPWQERDELGTEHPNGGVYLLARFERQPGKRSRPWPKLPKGVIYVGQTHNLNNRPVKAHNRTERYNQMFGDPSYTHLYVSVFYSYETGCDLSFVLGAFSIQVEAMLVWEYVKQHGQLPAMHFKDSRK